MQKLLKVTGFSALELFNFLGYRNPNSNPVQVVFPS